MNVCKARQSYKKKRDEDTGGVSRGNYGFTVVNKVFDSINKVYRT